VCGGLKKSMDLWQAVLSVCSEKCLTLCADGSEGSDMRGEEVIQTQEEGACLAVALRAVKAADTECYVCKIVVLTVVQACTVASAFWQCVCSCDFKVKA
jgi:hypothetical protein